MQVAVLVPVKDFSRAKARLAGDVDPDGRRALARWMATRVVRAAAPAAVYVVCDDDEVAAWAAEVGAQVLWTPGVGLNGAVTDGVAAMTAEGIDHVVVAHSDVPLAHDLTAVARPGRVTLVPDRHDDGTNVLAVPTDVGFTFSYGARSFEAHRAEAVRLGLAVDVVRSADLSIDVDTHADLLHPAIARLLPEVLPTWTPPTNPVSPL